MKLCAATMLTESSSTVYITHYQYTESGASPLFKYSSGFSQADGVFPARCQSGEHGAPTRASAGVSSWVVAH